jgi:MFS transporter, DHA1 family, multidrug resistance protein
MISLQCALEPYIIEAWGVSATAASLGLALYVLGYGIGPLIFSPCSEIPIIGRNPPYMMTFAIFVILCVPTALVNNITGLLIHRFLQGLFGSPCLATGGASIGDLYNLLKLPYFLTIWACFAACGPALGPLISGFSVPAENWRWSLWEMLWFSGATFIWLMFCLPETSVPNIPPRRAQRLRKLTGNQNIKSQSEIEMSEMTVKEIIVTNLWRPFQINALDPAVLFTSVYTALVYSIYYSFFEVFPLVYGSGNSHQPSTNSGYNFNLGQMGLVFLSISIGIFVAIPCYFLYLRYVFEPEVTKNGVGASERPLIPAIFASILVPAGLFLFVWTGNSALKVYWIVPTIGVAINSMGIFILLQCIFIYIPLSYSQYSASLFAGNDFLRSVLGTAPSCSLGPYS